MGYRVIQWGTGNVGLFALRAILDHPDLELAGVWVHDAAEVGQDVGTLCGRALVGIAATNDAESLLAMGADCVCYAAITPSAPYSRRPPASSTPSQTYAERRRDSCPPLICRPSPEVASIAGNATNSYTRIRRCSRLLADRCWVV